VHPHNRKRLFVVFNSSNQDAVWYSDDGGNTWSNRSGNLPTVAISGYAPPVVGVTFNPLLDEAAYAVTPVTAYHTTDSGQNWHEW
jgi:photosystem II stability/assembly factor-like uncharacterized protein